VPSWLAQNASVMPVQSLVQDPDTGLVGHDVFGDGSLLLVRLPGHAAGQVGAYIPGRLLIATDASWGNDLLPYSSQLRLPTRLIQRDYETYKETATLVQGVVDRGIPVYFSHGQYDRRELL
jgi:metallo-beta-lactamase domain protein